MPEPMEELLKRTQQKDAFAQEKLKELDQAHKAKAERSPWE
jgi:hypothetical protein